MYVSQKLDMIIASLNNKNKKSRGPKYLNVLNENFTSTRLINFVETWRYNHSISSGLEWRFDGRIKTGF